MENTENFSREEQATVEAANDFARANKKKIAKELTDTALFPPDTKPVSVFMAGSPGAGKTESSKNLIKQFSADKNHTVLRIDPDDLRVRFLEYTGGNSNLFMGAVSIISDAILDRALANDQSFIFDGTFSNVERARKNIQRSLSHGRFVQIVYVYQNPQLAWRFVKAREVRDGRTIPKSAFIEHYFGARSCVDVVKAEFGDLIKVDAIVKDIDGRDFSYYANIEKIDNHIPEQYTRDDIKNLLSP